MTEMAQGSRPAQAAPGRKRRRVILVGIGVLVLLVAVFTWLIASGGPYPTPEAAAEAYVGSVEEQAGGALNGEVSSVSVQGDTAQVVVEWSGSHTREQVLVVTKTSA